MSEMSEEFNGRENYFRYWTFLFSSFESDYFCAVLFRMDTWEFLLPRIHFLRWESFGTFSMIF